MNIIYEPKGKALEYSPLAANLYRGCGHGCTYCYAPSATYTDRALFYSAPSARKDVLGQLEKDARKLAGDPRQVLLCFTTDPYQPLNDRLRITGEAIRVLNENRLGVAILSKGGSRAIRDFDTLRQFAGNSYGATLTHDDPIVSQTWEPGAALPQDRIDTLKRAHDLGIKTWVSFEPVYDPEAVYRLLDATHDFVDLYKVGKLNYHQLSKTIDWPAFRKRITALLAELGKQYIIKRDLLAA